MISLRISSSKYQLGTEAGHLSRHLLKSSWMIVLIMLSGNSTASISGSCFWGSAQRLEDKNNSPAIQWW